VDAGDLLTLLRPLVVLVDPSGRVRRAHGGCGGFLGHEPSTLVGTNILDLVVPAERMQIGAYFTGDAGRHRPIALPLPFRMRLLDTGGDEHVVDVVVTSASMADPDDDGWVLMLTPLTLQAGSTRSLDAELAGASRAHVKRLLAQELEVDDAERLVRVVLVDLAHGEVIPGHDTDHGLADLVLDSLHEGWRPWESLPLDADHHHLPLVDAPPAVRERLTAGGWHIVEVAAVELDDTVVAAFIRATHRRAATRPEPARTTVEQRLRGLVDMTRLLYGRWRDQDVLMAAATTDPLTGLANRDTLNMALAMGEEAVGVIYIDIDRFKEVNDEWGHAAGDLVLVEVARRITSACRRDDVVARVGGDEFVVLLRKVDEVIAGRICRRILDEVRLPMLLADGPRHVSVSIGLAMDRSLGDLVEQADRAMLAAKRQGRSRLVTA
jgi:diguanylate cyclase (GGDEF)-like protein